MKEVIEKSRILGHRNAGKSRKKRGIPHQEPTFFNSDLFIYVSLQQVPNYIIYVVTLIYVT